MVKVGICGKMNTGKDTVAKMLALIVDGGCEKIAFATPIKQMAATMFPWMDWGCWFGSSTLRNTIIPNTTNRNGKPLTCREALIDIGTQGREYNPDHWVNLYDAWIQRQTFYTNDTIVVLDVRYRNEYAYLRKNNYFLIKLLRDQTITTDFQSHATETSQDEIALSEFDAVIENNGTLNELQTKVRALKSQILAHQNA